MITPAIPADEAQRLAALKRLGMLDTPSEERFDRITRVAGRLFTVPIAVVSLVDTDREWFKSCYGTTATEGPRSVSFCGHAILTDEPLIVPDTLSDPRFADNPQVTAAKPVRFYAGQPLRGPGGQRVGVLCLKDFKPRTFSVVEAQCLKDLARWAEQELNGLTLEQQAKANELLNRRLQETAALKDEFVAKVSHEIRTPLTSIKEGLSLMVEGALGTVTAEQRDYLQTMDGDIDRLTELINNTLDISKIEAGRMRLVRGRLDVRPLIESMVRSYQPILGRRNIELSLDGAPPVFADPNRLRQVLANLLSNALKFTKDDGAITFRVAAQGGFVGIAIEDDGPGIAQDDFPKLFQKFSQIGPQGGNVPRGTGLGLAVCKELTELHGGRITVSSVVDRGSTFTVHLPVYSEELALSASLDDLRRSASAGQLVGLLAVQADALCAAGSAQQDKLNLLADQVRRQLHRDDIALTVAPAWIAVIALTDVRGLKAMARRLRQSLPGGEQLAIGGTLDADGIAAVELFKRAGSAEGRALLTEPVS